MSNTTVYQIVLKAYTAYRGGEITVSLYSGETLAGQCKSHSGSAASKETLSCDRVAADRVRLTMSSTSNTWLRVYEIKVSRVPTMTIGLYLVSARIISSKTMRVSRWCRVSGSAFLIILIMLISLTQISCLNYLFRLFSS